MNYNNTPIDWKEVSNVISSYDRIILTTHENPDGDGLGSEIAMYHHLVQVGKEVKIINCSSTPRMFNYLSINNCIETYDESNHLDWISKADLVIVFDVGDFNRTRDIKIVIEKNNIPVMNIDHHPHPEDHSFTYNIVDVKSAATGCMVRSYLEAARKEPLTKEICDGIYTAVMTDTGCFRYSNTDPYCHEIAIECLNHGVNTNSIYQNIYENSTKTRIKVLGEMISNIKFDLEGKFAWSVLNDRVMKKHNADKSDLEGFADFIRAIKDVEVSLIIYEMSKNCCRINFRSKGNFTVNNIAKAFGGGGHAFASGAVINRPLKEVENNLIDDMKNMIIDQINNQI